MLVLPFPPSMNTYWRNFRGRTVLSKAGREYKVRIAEYVAENNIPKYGEQKLKITMILQPKDKRKIDIDNRIKCVLDSLQEAGVFDDDFHVDELHVMRGEQVKGGRLLLTIEVINDERATTNPNPTEPTIS